MRQSILLCAAFGALGLATDVALAQWSVPAPVAEVNTPFEEWTPFLSFDGLTLYFSRLRTDTFYDGRIFAATRHQPVGPFTSVAEVFRCTGHAFSPWVSPDNLRLYYHNEQGSGWFLKVSERASVNDPWPDGVDVPGLNAPGRLLQYPRLTPDERIIFYSAYDLPGGQGGYDIGTATRPNRHSSFDAIRNLSEINTTAADKDATLTADGLTIVFSSDRNHPGNAQLFLATRPSLDEPFGKVEPLSFFDSPGGGTKHPFLTADGAALYFMIDFSQTDRDIWVSHRVPLAVAVDIKPGSCPNPLNLASRGVLPVALLGQDNLDIHAIDLPTVRLAGVAPLRAHFEDVATPVEVANECARPATGTDGHLDLMLHCNTPQIVEQLLNGSPGGLAKGQQWRLMLTGALKDGTAIEGADCIVTVGKAR